MSIPQTIMGKYGWEKVTTTAQKQKLGTRMQIADREFVYVKAGEALTAGMLIMGQAGTAAEQVDLAVAAGSVGDTTSALDAMQIHYFSERCLVTQGANNFMLMK